MRNVTDEELMAFADGELDEVDQEEVRRLLLQNSALQSRLHVYEATRGPIARAFDPVLDAPVPEVLRHLVLQAPITPSMGGGRVRVAPQGRELSGVFAVLQRWLAPAPALVGATALGVAGVLGWMGHAQLGGPPQGVVLVQSVDGDVMASAPLARVLDRVPSGGQALLATETRVEPSSTFAARSGETCREYRVVGTTEGFAGFACRQTAGSWRIELHTPIAAGAADGGIVPAAGRGSESFDAAVDAAREGDVLDKAAEAAMLAEWGKVP